MHLKDISSEAELLHWFFFHNLAYTSVVMWMTSKVQRLNTWPTISNSKQGNALLSFSEKQVLVWQLFPSHIVHVALTQSRCLQHLSGADGFLYSEKAFQAS
jgi:hypothetical protein